MNSLSEYILIFFAGALCTAIAMWAAMRLARRVGLMDRPGVRKVHTSAVPRVGGIVVVFSLLLVLGGVLLFRGDVWRAFLRTPTDLLVILGAPLGMAAVGLADDIGNLRARSKLFWQLILAIVVCAAGVRIQSVHIGDSLTLQLHWLSWPLTILWILGFTNAINLIDGLDGVAGGISAIACAVVVALGIHTGQGMMTCLSLVLLGNVIGFLFFNVHPARVFMGDTGSLFLGSFLAIASVFLMSRTDSLVGLAWPALVLGVPFTDMVFIVLRRLIERRPIFAPDRNHLHHRLLNKGFSHRQAMVLMNVASLFSAMIGAGLLLTGGFSAVAVFLAGIIPIFAIHRISGRSFRNFFATAREAFRAHRINSKDFENFVKLQTRLRDARDATAWWFVVRRAARFLGFVSMTVRMQQPDGKEQLLYWRNPKDRGDGVDQMVIRLQVRSCLAKEPLQLVLEIMGDEGLETAARRLSLFGRLLDDRSIAKMSLDLSGLRQGRGRSRPLAAPMAVARSFPAETHKTVLPAVSVSSERMSE